MRDSRSQLARILRWTGCAVATTGLLWLFRAELDKSHMALAFLLVVLVASAREGRRVGLGLAVLCFLCFNFFLLPPYYTFIVEESLDWGVLLAFLVTGTIAAQLLYRAQREALIANQRAEEIDRLSMLGAETLNAGRAEQAVEAIARVIRSTLRIASCEIHIRDVQRESIRCVARVEASQWDAHTRSEELFEQVILEGGIALEDCDGRTRVLPPVKKTLTDAIEPHRARVLAIPLQVRGFTVGILRLADHEPIRLDTAQVRFAEVLSYYAALGVERVRLAEDAERIEALQQADRLKEALIASVSHDLRTPLTSIKALAHDLGAEGDERARTIEEQADRLNRLVANLLDLSRLNAGALPVSPELVAAEDLLGTALQQISGTAGRRIRVSLGEADEMLIGRFDFAHSLRALVNLLENAIKYSPKEAPIEVRVEREGAFHAFSVLDRGSGIPASEIERIFEPFYRMPDTEPDVTGTGLGLAIARRLAEVQGGAIRYQPRCGGGAVFTLLLAAVDVADAPPEAGSGTIPVLTSSL